MAAYGRTTQAKWSEYSDGMEQKETKDWIRLYVVHGAIHGIITSRQWLQNTLPL